MSTTKLGEEKGSSEKSKNGGEKTPKKRRGKETVPFRIGQRHVPEDVPVARSQRPRGLLLGQVLGLLFFCWRC